MASDHTFDIVSKVNMEEVLNAMQHSMKEINQRFDFKGSKSDIDLNKEKSEITVVSDDDYKLQSVVDILKSKLVKRKVSLKMLEFGKVEEAGGNTVKQVITLQQGIKTEDSKKIIKLIKDMKLKKVQTEIQKDQLRIKAKKIDDLQEVITILKEKEFEFHMEFINFR